MIKKILLPFCMMTILLTTSLSWGQKVGTTSFQFLKVIPDARSTAMGEAYVAADASSEVLFWNPGAAVSVSKLDVSISHVNWFMDTQLYAFSAAFSFPAFGTVGVLGMYNDYGAIDVTRVDFLDFNPDGTFNPGLTGETMLPKSMLIGFSYARSLTNKFSFGLTAKWAHEDLYLEKASTFLFDGGILYDTGFKSVRIGAVIRHFGPEVKFVNETYPLPQTFEVGASAKLLSPGEALFSEVKNHELLFVYSIVHPRDYAQQQTMGLEYSWNNLFFIRGGYKFNFDEETLTTGLGFRIANARLDYSYIPMGNFLEPVHRFSFGYGLN